MTKTEFKITIKTRTTFMNLFVGIQKTLFFRGRP